MLLSIFLSHKIPARRFIRCKVMIDEVTAQLLFFLPSSYICISGFHASLALHQQQVHKKKKKAAKCFDLNFKILCLSVQVIEIKHLTERNVFVCLLSLKKYT
jgi:hypothetical protein